MHITSRPSALDFPALETGRACSVTASFYYSRYQGDERTRSQAHDLAADIMFAGGRHWKVLVLLMIQTCMIGMVVLGGDREKDVKSTVSVLNEIGIRFVFGSGH